VLRLLLHVWPAQVLEDLDLDLLTARAAALEGWQVELHDTRLSDAPYVTVVAEAADITSGELDRLQVAFADLPQMDARLWVGVGKEVSLASVDAALIREAAARTPQRPG
jgi:hypothetical protein